MTKSNKSSTDGGAFNRRSFLRAVGAAGASAGPLLASTEPCRMGAAHPVSVRGQEVAAIARKIKVQVDIPFVKRADRTLLLDVYSPVKKPSHPMPAIVTFGFAAWVRSSKELCMTDLEHIPSFPTPYLYPPAMVPHGFVVVSAETRVAPADKFPAEIYDGKCAVQWIRTHAQELYVDPSRIGVIGGSASGYLAAMLGVTRPEDGFEDPENFAGVSSAVQAVHAGSGMYDFEYYHAVPGENSLPVQVAQFLGGTYDQVPDAYRKASPTTYVRPGAPPFLLTHGLADRRVPFEQQTRFIEVLSKSAIPTQAVYINHLSHALPKVEPDPSYPLVDELIYKFFEYYLKP